MKQIQTSVLAFLFFDVLTEAAPSLPAVDMKYPLAQRLKTSEVVLSATERPCDLNGALSP